MEQSVNHVQQPTPESLLVEYQAAQDSAQHHDTLVWSITSVMWGGSLVLMGLILQVLTNTSLRALVTVLSIIGILLTAFVWVFARQLNAYKNKKYARCKEIEAILHLQQHTRSEWKQGSQKRLYSILMVMFLIAWVLILLMTFWPSAPSPSPGASLSSAVASSCLQG